MRFQVALSNEALRQLRGFRASDRRLVLDAIQRSLRGEPVTISRNRKPLRGPERSPAWEYRVGEFRIFYDVDVGRAAVTVVAVARKGRRTTAEVLDETDNR